MGKSLAPEREIAELPFYDKIGWSPHAAQVRIINARARNRIVAAGRRFGKSQVGGHKLAQECVNTRLVKNMLLDAKKRREFWIIGPSYTDSEKEFRVLWNALAGAGLKEYFDRPGSYNDPIGGSMHLSMWEGTFQVHAKSEKHPDSLVGEGLSGAVLAEGAKLKRSTWEKLIRPTLADFEGWMFSGSTPEGKNWWYDLWRIGQDPSRPDWHSMRAPSWMNPHVYPMGASDEGIEQLRKALERGETQNAELFNRVGVDPEIAALVGDLTPEAFNQEIGAGFTTFVGRVFKEFDEEIHVGDLEYNPAWATYACCDYGFTNPSVWLLIQVDPFGERINVLGEVYESGLAPDEFADEIENRGLNPSTVITFYPDPASPGDTAILEKKLRVKHSGGTGGEIKWRIDGIRKWLKYVLPHQPTDHPENRPRLMFDRSCIHTISDMQEYRYPEKKSESMGVAENPMKKDDHGPEALGRFFAGKFGTPDKIARRSRQRRADVSR